MDFGIKDDIPIFDGAFNPAAYIDWELEVEQSFTRYMLLDSRKIVVATS